MFDIQTFYSLSLSIDNNSFSGGENSFGVGVGRRLIEVPKDSHVHSIGHLKSESTGITDVQFQNINPHQFELGSFVSNLAANLIPDVF